MIFPFVRFLDFFHSVKKVSKPIIFCEIMCIKEDLGYLDCIAQLSSSQKNCIFVFSFICMIYKWGGDFIRGNFPRGGDFHREQFSRGRGGILGGNFHRGELS